jgi:D-serine deaminase-like pyridoxal phosphate-dependent protein
MAGHIDRDAVAAIGEERVDWRFKGMPATRPGMTIGKLADERLDLFDSGFALPLLTLDAAALEHNLTTFAAWCARHGLAHAPHGKTTMAPQLFARQFDHGAWGQTCANLSQLRVYRAFGVSPVLLANQLVDPRATAWVAGELERDESFEFCCWVDSVRGVSLMTESLQGISRPVDVLVELGVPSGRAGVRDLAEGVAVAEAVAREPALRLVGVGGYEGPVTNDTTPEALGSVREYLTRLRALAAELAGRGHFDGLDRVIVTAGGSGYFDQVAEVFGEPWPDGLPVLPVVRSGAYVSHDSGTYLRQSPLGAFPRLADTPPLRPAARIWAQVTSTPEPGLALLTAGKRDLPFDIDLPMPEVVRRHGQAEVEPLEATVFALNDQHAYVRHSSLEVGDLVGLAVSHPCTTFDKWPLIPVVDDGVVVDLVRTYF